MIFLKVTDSQEGSRCLSEALLTALDKDFRVLWLVSGGTNVDITIEVLDKLDDNKLNNLALALVDERYGKPGHKDSNYYKFQQAGLDFSRVDFKPVISSQNLGFEDCVKTYEKRLQSLFNDTDVMIGQFGIGADGHTAGILPHSEACNIDKRLVIGYQAPDFQRITLTFTAIKLVNEAYVFAFGEDKRLPLSLLYDKNLALTDQPAQIFRQYLPKSFIINNMIGDVK